MNTLPQDRYWARVNAVRAARALIAQHGRERAIRLLGTYSVTARRLRAVKYAGKLREYCLEACPWGWDPTELAALLETYGYLDTIRALLAEHCDPAFARLTAEHVLTALTPPTHGPKQRDLYAAAGAMAAAVGAFGDRDPEAAAARFKNARKEKRRERSRAK